MSSLKRKNPAALLERRVRPRKDEDSDIEEVEDLSDAGSSESGESDGSDASESEDGGEKGEDVSHTYHVHHTIILTIPQDSDEASEEEADPKLDIAQISFGALAKAQATLPSLKRGKKSSSSATKAPAPAEDGRFRDFKSTFLSAEEKAKAKAKAAERAKRSSKHAPMEVTSKAPVSRRRDIVEIPKSKARDPRFDPLPGAVPLDEVKARRNYSFLDDYRESELKELKGAARKEKDARKKEELNRAVLSMESKKKAQERKDREKKIIEEHRKAEKEKVAQGKQPFYLKKSEQKKRVLLDQFSEMSKRKVDKVIERRRKKIAGKEKKDLPYARRGAEME
jgi:ribosomal RNA-processing protein 36